MIETRGNLATGAVAQNRGSKELERAPLEPYTDAAALTAGIHRVIADRDKYRVRADDLERETVRLRALNEEIRKQTEQVSAVRDHYMRVATELFTHIKQIDTTIQAIVQKTSQRDQLVALAQRLSSQMAVGSDASITGASNSARAEDAQMPSSTSRVGLEEASPKKSKPEPAAS